MNIVLVLAVVVCCVCGEQPLHNPRGPLHNPNPHIRKKTQVLADRRKLETTGKEDVLGHVDKSDIQSGKTHSISIHEHHKNHSQFCFWNKEDRILNMNNKYLSQGKLKTLPGLVRMKQEEINTTLSLQNKDCTFVCPDAESLAPCRCDPCARSINCSAVESFEQLFDIFHRTTFPNPSFESFFLVSSLMGRHKWTSRSDSFLANTFGEATFTSIRVESMATLKTVEAGAFLGSETTLKSLIFAWNSVLLHFPFTELEKMETLQKLTVSGSMLNSLPVFPHIPKLADLFLDNNLISSLSPNTFTALSSLMYLDLGYNSLLALNKDSLHFSAPDLIVYLDGNTLESIDDQTFSGKQPILVDVSCNVLIGLNQNVFQPILDHIIEQEYNSYVDGTYNPLQCPYISWLMDNPFYLNLVALDDPPCSRTS